MVEHLNDMNKIIIGETCLLDKQLRRCGIIDDFHGCFDNTLINLDGLLEVIKDDFKYLFDDNYLKMVNYLYYPKHGIYHNKWVNGKYTVNVDNIYSWDVMSFFHLDNVNESEIQSIKRKIERTKQWFEDDEDTLLFYYYRYNDNYNQEKHLVKLRQFLSFISDKYNKSFKCVNINNIIGVDKLTIDSSDNNILNILVSSKNSWIDIDDNWDAHTDNHIFDFIFTTSEYKNFTS